MKAKITFLGGEETGDVGRTNWGGYEFELNKPVEVTDPHIIEKALTNKFFKVEMLDDGKSAGLGAAVDEDDEEDEGKAPARSHHAAPGRTPSRSR